MERHRRGFEATRPAFESDPGGSLRPAEFIEARPSAAGSGVRPSPVFVAIPRHSPGGREAYSSLCRRDCPFARWPVVGDGRPFGSPVRRGLCRGEPHRLLADLAALDPGLPGAAAGFVLHGDAGEPAKPGEISQGKPADRLAHAGADASVLFRGCVSLPVFGLYAGRRRRPRGAERPGRAQDLGRAIAGRCDLPPDSRCRLRPLGTRRDFAARHTGIAPSRAVGAGVGGE